MDCEYCGNIVVLWGGVLMCHECRVPVDRDDYPLIGPDGYVLDWGAFDRRVPPYYKPPQNNEDEGRRHGGINDYLNAYSAACEVCAQQHDFVPEWWFLEGLDRVIKLHWLRSHFGVCDGFEFAVDHYVQGDVERGVPPQAEGWARRWVEAKIGKGAA